jgi:hypothetical protein
MPVLPPRHLFCTPPPDLPRAAALRSGAGHIATTVPEVRKALCRLAWRAAHQTGPAALKGAAPKLFQCCDPPATKNWRDPNGRIGKPLPFGTAVALQGLAQAMRSGSALSQTIRRTRSAADMCATVRSPKCLNCETVARQDKLDSEGPICLAGGFQALSMGYPMAGRSQRARAKRQRSIHVPRLARATATRPKEIAGAASIKALAPIADLNQSAILAQANTRVLGIFYRAKVCAIRRVIELKRWLDHKTICPVKHSV